MTSALLPLRPLAISPHLKSVYSLYDDEGKSRPVSYNVPVRLMRFVLTSCVLIVAIVA